MLRYNLKAQSSTDIFYFFSNLTSIPSIIPHTIISIDQEQLNPVIHILGLGAIRGQRDEQVPVVRFLNVPFATVSKRWRPGIPVKEWEGIRDATKPG